LFVAVVAGVGLGIEAGGRDIVLLVFGRRHWPFELYPNFEYSKRWKWNGNLNGESYATPLCHLSCVSAWSSYAPSSAFTQPQPNIVTPKIHLKINIIFQQPHDNNLLDLKHDNH